MPVTSNANNNYEVEIIEHPDISTLFDNPPVTPPFMQMAGNGIEFIEWKITPTTLGYPLIASNMRLKGNPPIPGSYWYNEVPWTVWRPGNMNGQYTGPNPNIQPQNDECTPPVTPHNLTPSQTPLPMITQGSQWCTGTACQGFGIGQWMSGGARDLYQASQVVEFVHPATNYPNLGIGSPNVEGIYSQHTIMVEVYEDDNGNLVNDNLHPSTNFMSGIWPNTPTTYLWIQWDAINHAPITNNIYPKYLKCFTFIEGYNSNLLNYQAPQVLDLLFDLDEIPPTSGCTDPSALNYNANAVVDDGSCSYSGSQTYQIQLNFDLSNAYSPPGVPGVNPPGPYTDGTTYSFTVPYPQSQTFSYTTVDFDATQGVDQNLRYGNGALTDTVLLSNSYNPGDAVTETVEIWVYPYVDQSGGGPVIYDFPGANLGGPNGMHNLPDPNSSNYDDYIQQIFPGWGSSKNNLTAASLRVELGGIGSLGWLNPEYEDPSTSPLMSLWHNGPDPTGLQPTQDVTFSSSGSLPNGISEVSAHEEYNPVGPANPARDWFPSRVKVKVTLDFTAPSPQMPFNGPSPWSNNDTLYSLPVSLVHVTTNQGDLNWTI